VDGVRGNKPFSAIRFTKNKNPPTKALGFGEPYPLIAFPNSPFPLVVVVAKAYREKSFVDMRELTVSMIYKTTKECATHYKRFIQPFIYASLTIVTVIDFMITSAMCYYLNRSQSSFVG